MSTENSIESAWFGIIRDRKSFDAYMKLDTSTLTRIRDGNDEGPIKQYLKAIKNYVEDSPKDIGV